MLLKPKEEYSDYTEGLEKLNEAKLKWENQQKLFEESQKISDKLSETMGISKIGEQIDFEQIDKAERQTKIKSREVKIAEKEYQEAQKEFEKIILGVREKRKIEARKIAIEIHKGIINATETLKTQKENYKQLTVELAPDITDQDAGGIATIIGFDPATYKKMYFYIEKAEKWIESQEKIKD